MAMSSQWHDVSVYRIPSSASKLLVTASNDTHTPLFYVSPSLYACKNRRPDITLHRIQPTGLNANVSADGRKLSSDESKQSPVVATAHWRNTRKHIGLAFGDPGPDGSNSESMHWEQMTRETISKGRFSFTMPPSEVIDGTKHFVNDFCPTSHHDSTGSEVHEVGSELWWEAKSPAAVVRSDVRRTGSSSASTSIDGRRMTWKRTHSLESGLENAAFYRVISAANFKLIDDTTGKIVALFESNGLKSFRKLGRLKISKEEAGEDGKVDEHMLLCAVLTYCVIWEQMRRDG